jgi:peptidoglycan/xylan/chitin deacetylase (PgdA/CDA1 family)
MTLLRVVRQAWDAWEVPRDLVLGRYPEFVRGGALPRGQVPVFVFHSLETETFRRKLEYLSANGYVTLSAVDYFQFLMGTRPVPDRAIVLTFDDGRASLWTVGAPLLRRFGMTGIVFLIPGRTVSRPGPLPPTIDDPRAETLAPTGGDEGLLSWEQIEALSRSGPFEFQSHTHTHARVHVRPRVVGFVTPESRRGYAALDLPMIHAGARDLMGEEVAPGTPILAAEPRMGEARRFYEDPAIRKAAVRAVAEGGGDAFFAREDWPEVLRATVRRRVAGRWETAAEKEAAIRRELVESKRVIEERTGKPVIHLCHPWHVAGPTARRVMREVGYRTAFAGKVPGVPITMAGGDPYGIARIGEDYVELLPGEGRAALADVLRRKWRRRMGGKR